MLWPIVPGPKSGYAVRLGGLFAVSDSEYVIGFAHFRTLCDGSVVWTYAKHGEVYVKVLG